MLTGCGGDSSGPITPPQLVWSSVPTGTTQNINGIWGTSASDVWAVGWTVVRHYDGTSWTSFPISANTIAFGVWGTSPSNVWLVGMDGTPLHYDGANFTRGPALPILSL